MLEFEFNSHVEIAALVEFFARCGWRDDEAEAKVGWALAASDDWVVCKAEGELVAFGRSCSFGPLNRVVFDVTVDSRYRGRGLKAEIVRLLSVNTGMLEEVSVFAGSGMFGEEMVGSVEASTESGEVPWASPNTYIGRLRKNESGVE
jgi:hypothetical protein